MQQRESSLAKLLRDRSQLQEMLSELRALLDRPEEECCADSGWGSQVAVRLVKLHDRLFRNFREEEASGALEEFSRRQPASSTRCEDLYCQHSRILRDLRTVLTSAMSSSDSATERFARLRIDVYAIVDLLTQHEKEETDLMRKLYSSNQE